MQSKSSQKVITGNQKNVTSISQKFSKIKGIRYVKREKMNFRFSHPLFLVSRKCLEIKRFRLFVVIKKRLMQPLFQKFSIYLITFSVVAF